MSVFSDHVKCNPHCFIVLYLWNLRFFIFLFIKIWATDLSAVVKDPAHLDDHFLQRAAVQSFETKHAEKNIVVLALLCWLFMERIHPSFCALRAGAMRVGILGSEGYKRGNDPLQHVGGRWGPLVPQAFEIRCSRVHSSTHTWLNMHTQRNKH